MSAAMTAPSSPEPNQARGGQMERVLQALWDATPEPPASDAEPAETLARAQLMVGDRCGPLAELVELTRRGVFPGAGCDELRARLDERQARWLAAMTRARALMAERISSARRLHRVRT